MKKMFLASCLLAASVFAAPQAEEVKAAADQAKPAVEAKVSTASAKVASVKKNANTKAASAYDELETAKSKTLTTSKAKAAAVPAAAKTEAKAAAATVKTDAKAAATTATTAAKTDVQAAAAPAAKVEAKAAAVPAAATTTAATAKTDAKAAVANVKTSAKSATATAKANVQTAKTDAKAAAATTATAATTDAKAAVATAKADVQAAVPAQKVEQKAEVQPIIPALEPTTAEVKAQANEAVQNAAPAIQANAQAEAPVNAVEPAEIKTQAKPAAIEPVAEKAPVSKPAPVAEAKPVVAPVEEVVAATEASSTNGRKKKKMIENAVFTVNQIDFDINADFELKAGKVLWTTEDDNDMDNLETWNGQANFAVLAETNNFKGKIAVAFYPGDLKADNHNGEMGKAPDYLTLDEAWAYQSKNWFSFKVGRWDNTDKNGDYFGGYIDGYKNGFLSTQDAENQFEFGFVPNENIDIAISFISKAPHLNKGDVRAVFNFHDLPSLELFEIQLGYRSNIFDRVNSKHVDIKHNTSLKVRYPILPNFAVFGEVALMDISDNMVVPLTGGIELNFKTVDRVILEAEYVNNRHNHKDFWNMERDPKHVKDVLGALYLEKALTDRFSLSAGLHNFGVTKDFMISGDLIGRIN